MSKTTAKGGVSALSLIDANIKYVRTTSKNVQDRIQATIIMIMEHAAQHGDCDRAKSLVLAMPKGTRRSLVVKHFAKFSPIAVHIDVKNESKSTVRLRKSDSKSYNAFNVAGAKAVPWHTLEPERQEEFNLDVEAVEGKIANMAAFLERKLKEGKIVEGAVERTRQLIQRLQAA